MADYTNIDVGYAIKPAQANVTLGDVVCFTSPVVTASGMNIISLKLLKKGGKREILSSGTEIKK